MGEMTFDERDSIVREQMKEEGLGSTFDVSARDVFTDGLNAIYMSGGNRGGCIYLPNERLAVLWRKMFRVQFTDGAWRDVNTDFQMEHPFAYSDAEIEIDSSLKNPKFESYDTHEQMETPLNHFDVVPQFYEDMIYLIRMFTGDDSYGMEELKQDLRLFDQMEFDVASVENCSQCNSEIY
jgi:hypothetical protein